MAAAVTAAAAWGFSAVIFVIFVMATVTMMATTAAIDEGVDD